MSCRLKAKGFRLAYQEAAAFGKPSIGLDIECIRESIFQDDTGVLVSLDEDGALSDAVVGLLSNTDRRTRMGDAARRRVETELNWDQIAKGFRDILQEITSAKGGKQ